MPEDADTFLDSVSSRKAKILMVCKVKQGGIQISHTLGESQTRQLPH